MREVASYVDRRSLPAFVRVSSLCWELGAPRLYRQMSVNGRELRRMFLRAGGRPLRRKEIFIPPPPDGDTAAPIGQRTRRRQHQQRHALALAGSLTPRFRRALQWVEDLVLRAPMQVRVNHMIWDAAAAGGPGVPLFPGVKRLRIDHTIEIPTPASPPLKEKVLVFDRVVFCCGNQHRFHREIASFPAVECKIVSHGEMAAQSMSLLGTYGLPKSCTSIRLFGAFVRHFVRHLVTVPFVVTQAEEQLAKVVDASLEVYLLGLPANTVEPEEVDAMYRSLKENGWTPHPDNRVKISFGEHPEVPPCAVCGRWCLKPSHAALKLTSRTKEPHLD